MSNETEQLETNLRKEITDVKMAIISEIGDQRTKNECTNYYTNDNHCLLYTSPSPRD